MKLPRSGCRLQSSVMKASNDTNFAGLEQSWEGLVLLLLLLFCYNSYATRVPPPFDYSGFSDE